MEIEIGYRLRDIIALIVWLYVVHKVCEAVVIGVLNALKK